MKKLSPPRILVVDDEEKIRQSLSGLLDDNGYKAITAENGLECLQIVASQHIDLVILDIIMPEMSGIEVLRKIKEKCKDTEVIMITGYADKEKAIAAFRLGAYDLIEKPFESKEILNTVSHSLTQLDLRREVERKNLELRKSQELMRLERDKFQGVLGAIGDGLDIVTSDYKVVYANENLKRIVGKNELEGHLCYEIFLDRDKPCGICPMRKAISNGRTVTEEITQPNGRIVEVSSSPLRLPTGEMAAIEIIKDITDRKLAEEALQDSERRYRLLAENVTDVIWTMDIRDMRVTYISPSIVRLRGYSVEEMLAQTLEEILTTSSLEVAMKTLEEEMAIENMAQKDPSRSRTLELEYKCKDGSTVWAEVKMTFLREPGGRPVGVLGVSRDITKRKSAEEALRRSEEQYRIIVEHSNDLIWTLDREGKFTYFNKRAEEVSGYRLTDWLGKSFAPLILFEDLPRIKKIFMETLGGNPQHYETRVYRKDRSSFVLSVNTAPIFESGGVVGTVSFGSDITEQKRSEELLREHDRQQKAILNNIPDIAWLKDKESRFIAVNEPFGSACGVKPENLVGKTDLDIWPRGLAERYRADDREVMETGRRKQVEEPLVVKDGKKTWIETIKIPIYNDKGEIIGTTGIARDITERKRAEEELRRVALENAELFESVKQQREQLRALTTRLAEAEEAERQRLARELHDQVLQNLTALGINLNVVQKHMPGEVLGRVCSRLDDSLALVEQTTERIRNVMADLKQPVLDDYGVVAASRWYGAQFFSRTGIAVYVQGEEPIPRLSSHVENAMFRITQEALTNIAKHAQATRVTITMEVEKETARLVITDNGIGFDPTHLAKSGNGRSWGILTMSERAEAIGGHFRIDSRTGEGTRVTVEVAR